MAFEKILSVSGKSGLFMLVGQMKNGIIVEGIADGKRFPIHGSSKVSALEEISIYTATEEVPLREVFTKMFEKEGGKQAMDSKAGDAEVKAYFESVLPDYDKDRVYTSYMVKIVRWYNLLIEHNAFDPKEIEEAEADATEGKEEKAAKSSDTKKAPKAAKKTASKSASKASSKSKASGASARTTGSQRGK